MNKQAVCTLFEFNPFSVEMVYWIRKHGTDYEYT